MKQIMVVDDEPLVREVIADILRDEGYMVLQASGGRKMLALLETEHPDLILLDVMMPDGDGREAYRTMQSDPRLRSIPVVMITTGLIGQQQLEGTLTFLEKPFDLEHLLRIVLNSIGPAS